MLRSPLLLALAGTLLAPLPLCGSPPRPTLEEVCTALRSGENPYFGRRLVSELRTRLESPPADVVEAATMRGMLGRELLRHGESAAAVRELETALASLDEVETSPELRSTLHWHLALAHLQRAEDENCVGHRTAESCILPLRGGGVHGRSEHARRAGDLFLAYVAAHPRNVQAGFLLNVARQASGDFPAGVPESLRLPPMALDGPPFPRFRDRAPELGIAAVDLAGGAVMDDFDGDGLLDLISSSWEPCTPLTAFRNDGRGGFEPVTERWGLLAQLGGLNLLQADYDGDGDLDLLVLRGAWLRADGTIRNSLLRNDLATAGRFTDVTEAAGLAWPAYPTQTAAWGDVDGDGDLDLYVGNEATKAGDYPSQLFVNRGDGTFEDRAEKAGVTNDRYAKGVAWGDYDEDGDLDLYVSNFGPNRLYRNDGDAAFTDVAPELGLTAPEAESFAVWFFDFDNDGDLDLFVADYRQQSAQVSASYFGLSFDEGQPLLYRNDGDGTFTETGRRVGLERPLMPMGANYGDLDNDGWLDVYLGTGEPDLASLQPNVMLRNARGRFVDVSMSGGFAHLQKGHGVAFGDVDNDGDQDLFHQLGGFYPADAFGNALFENPGGGGSWVTLRLEGRRANRFGVGARLELEVTPEGAEKRTIHVVAGSGGSFGASSLQQEIGLGVGVETIDLLRIRWPGSGTVQVLRDVPARRVYRVVEGEGELVSVALPTLRLGASEPEPEPTAD
jgi:hypothetical protein